MFALLGAATTVAVAWGVALRGIDLNRSRLDRSSPMAMPAESQLLAFWPKQRGPGWSSAQTFRLSNEVFVANGTHLDDVSPWTGYPRVSSVPRGWSMPHANESSVRVLSFGWPWPSLWSGGVDARSSFWNVWYLGTPELTSPRPYIRERTFGGRNSNRPWAIPIGIHWRVFAANAAVYACTLWLPLAAWTGTRRALRRRRGLCGRCAYDLRGLPHSAVCHECGTTRKRRATT